MRAPERTRLPWVGILVVLLVAAAALRLSGVLWDGGIGAHPDERHLVGVAEGLGWPDRLSPFATDPSFSYGHLPLYLFALVGGRDQLPTARLLAGLADTATVALAAALGRRMGGRRAGLLAAAFLVVMPLHVQQAHFGTVDPFLSLLSTGALLFASRLAETGRWRDGALAGLWVGLAAGCKITAVFLALPLVVACGLGPRSRRQRVLRGLAAAGAALGTFLVTNPFAVLHLPRFLANMAAQAALGRGAVLVPYTIQYEGTLAYLYPIGQQLAWGMGPVLGMLCLAGLGSALWQAVRQAPGRAGWVGVGFALPFLAFTGGLFAKYPRYLLPVTPLLAAFGGQAASRLARRSPWPGRAAAALGILPAGLLSLALVASYRAPHPWVAASEWLEGRLPPGSVVAVEAWDHPLPLRSGAYDLRVLPVFDEETEEKWVTIEEVLAEADVVVVASRRGYGALAGRSQRFPRMRAYYQALFAGERGFEVDACFGRWPRALRLAMADDPFGVVGLPLPDPACRPAPPVLALPRLDESLVVYDHPLVVILRPANDVAAAFGRWYNLLLRE